MKTRHYKGLCGPSIKGQRQGKQRIKLLKQAYAILRGFEEDQKLENNDKIAEVLSVSI